MSLSFATQMRRRRPSLTPMIDVVFLLLVFFLLVARFGAEGAIPIAAAGGGAADLAGPPRLVEVRPGALSLNGVVLEPPALLAQLSRLAPSPEDAVVLRARDEATLQDLVTALELLTEAGHGRLVLAE